VAPLPQLTYLGHATVLIEAGGARVLTDPVLTRSIGFLRRVVPEPEAHHHAEVDVVLISHLHHDHLHLPSLRRLADARVIAPRGAGATLARSGHRHVEELVEGQSVQHGRLSITATAAAHADRRRPLGGPRARPLGYLVEADGTSTYFAGDTDLFPGMHEMRPDIALLPVWGWGTSVGEGHLDPRRAAEALVRMGSRYAVPIHWGTLFPHQLLRVAPRLAHLLERPPHEFAEHARALGSTAEIAVTLPGSRVDFGLEPPSTVGLPGQTRPA
jgi:L-ascorbate metabolism protein UlaG (beta-lactamase superfamily)